MKDMSKLLLAQKLIGQVCKKVFIVSNKEAVKHLCNSWYGTFAKEFGIEIYIQEINNKTAEDIKNAQKSQSR